ncbi:MAG: Uma2 family endonuclease [Proteobacteria bacterium]|nr:Uma2 family endonuclease [Pseudomonadota bacterium]
MSRPAQALDQPTLYEQLIDLPENLTGEIINGELHTQPRPTGRHGDAGSVLGMHIGPPFRLGNGGPGGWWILNEPEIHFVRDTVVVVPDLAGWRRERMPNIPEGHRFEVVPDWVCEILSPSTGKKDRAKKLPLYARYGAAHAWLVDPLAQTLEAFSLHEGHWLLPATLEDDAQVSVAPFDAIMFSLADL